MWYLGRLLLSLYSLLMYSPITPRQSSWTLPIKSSGRSIEAQPGMALSVNNRVANTQARIPTDTRLDMRPMTVMARSGIAENAVIPFHAKDNIFLKGYLLSPASLAWRWYSTTDDGNPTSRTMPRKKRFDSSYSSKALRARRDIKRKSA